MKSPGPLFPPIIINYRIINQWCHTCVLFSELSHNVTKPISSTFILYVSIDRHDNNNSMLTYPPTQLTLLIVITGNISLTKQIYTELFIILFVVCPLQLFICWFVFSVSSSVEVNFISKMFPSINLILIDTFHK